MYNVAHTHKVNTYYVNNTWNFAFKMKKKKMKMSQ